MTQCSISGGFRMSTAKVYLDPARGGAICAIDTGAHAQCLLFEARAASACATRCRARPTRRGRRARLSCRPARSPRRSCSNSPGIGQSERLEALGIAVKHELRGVGENLRDHWAPRLKWRVGRHGVTFNERARGLRGLGQGLLYIAQRQRLPQPSGLADARLHQEPRRDSTRRTP
jgi:choline dehydrogenase